MVRRGVAGLGRTLVTAGAILLMFVVYQLWGTGINTARAQDSLARDLQGGGFDAVPEGLLSGTSTPGTAAPSSVQPSVETTTTATPTTAGPSTIAPSTTAPSTTTPSTIAPPTISPSPTQPPTTLVGHGRELVSHAKTRAVTLRAGEAVGQLVIPRISLNKAIVQGTSVEALKRGPGHYSTTPFPGEAGNAAVACHRTTYGGPCLRLDEVKPGDDIFVARKDAKGKAEWFKYTVYEKLVVKPSRNDVLLPRPGKNTLTLTTCHPAYSAKQRLVVHAELSGEAIESDLIDATQDPFAAEYQRQADVKNGVAVPTSTPAANTTVAGVESTVDEPTVDTPAETTAASAISSAESPTTVPVTSPPTTRATPAGAAPSAPSQPTFDGERAHGRIYRLGFFAGTAPAWTQTVLWGVVCAAIWAAAWALARKRRQLLVRAAIYTAGFVLLFGPALYFCFENVSRLLPEAV